MVRTLNQYINLINNRNKKLIKENINLEDKILNLIKENNTLKEYIIKIQQKLSPELLEDKEMLINLDLALSKIKS